MKIHELKCWPESFGPISDLTKNFDYRRDDGRSFEVGDVLWLREWKPEVVTLMDAMGGAQPRFSGFYTKRYRLRVVTFIERGPSGFIPPGFVVMSLRRLTPSQDRRRHEIRQEVKDREAASYQPKGEPP